MLRLEKVEAHYGNIRALKGIDIDINPGEIATIIGANGAGKTTTLMTVCGLVPTTSGKVFFQGDDITHRPTSDIIGGGIAMVPEGRRVFPRMTVQENLYLGAYLQRDKNIIKKDLGRVYERFPILRDRKRQVAGTLSGGEQQMLAMGRALMARPKLLLLDEPSMGLAPKIVTDIFKIIEEINREGTTILLVEQNALMALSIANKGFVIETGKIVLRDSAKDLLNNDEVRRAYLGE